MGDINDHCPIILDPQKSFYFQPDPVLQINPLKTITATDLDSGANGKIFFKVSEVKELEYENTQISKNCTFFVKS